MSTTPPLSASTPIESQPGVSLGNGGEVNSVPHGSSRDDGFSGEVPESFDELIVRVGRPRNFSGLFPKLALFVAQPLLGSLAETEMRWFEEAANDRRFYSVEAASGLNILLNLLLYPAIFGIIGSLVLGKSLFSQDSRFLIFFGLAVGASEAVLRCKEAMLSATPMSQSRIRPSIYGSLISLILRLILPSHRKFSRQIPIPVDGFYSGGFDQKRERERRYGTAYTLEDVGGAYVLRFEFPRVIPPAKFKQEMGLGNEMPDYNFDLSLVDGSFIVKGRCLDEKVRKLSVQLGSFPLEFATRIPVSSKITGFKHRYQDKLLEVILLKS